MKNITCCFTGHRELPSDTSELEKRLNDTLKALIADGYTKFVAGGAIGFDALAANSVLRLKEQFPQISLHLALPCRGQDRFWTDAQKEEYARHLELADSYSYICGAYTRFCMHQRNRIMVDMSSKVVAFYDGGEKGGTASTVKYASKKGIPVINIY